MTFAALLLALGPGWLVRPPIQRPSAPPVIVLDWRAPPSCPSEAEVFARLPPTNSRLSVQATIETNPSGFVVDLSLANVEGESRRSFAARDCATLTSAIVLLVAVTVDPVGVAEELAAVREAVREPVVYEPAPAPVPEPEPAIVDANPLVIASDPEPPRRRPPVRVGLRAIAGGGYGPTRGGHGHVGGSLVVLGDRWRWELGGSWSTPRIVRRDDVIGGRFDGWSVATRGCFAPVVARVIELPACLGIEAGQVRGRGLDSLPRAYSGSFSWLAPTLAQGLWWAPIEQVAIGVEIDVVVPLTRGSFLVDAVEVERTAAIGVRGLAGVEVRFGRNPRLPVIHSR